MRQNHPDRPKLSKCASRQPSPKRSLQSLQKRKSQEEQLGQTQGKYKRGRSASPMRKRNMERRESRYKQMGIEAELDKQRIRRENIGKLEEKAERDNAHARTGVGEKKIREKPANAEGDTSTRAEGNGKKRTDLWTSEKNLDKPRNNRAATEPDASKSRKDASIRTT